MRHIKIAVFGLAITSMLFLGCRFIEEPMEIGNMPRVKLRMMGEPTPVADQTAQTAQTDKAMENRFADPGTQSTGAVESAMMWSQKYERLMEKNQQLSEKNREMFLENNDIQFQFKKLQDELAMTKKELEGANAFMQEMHAELNKWKADVLGFRGEMRSAQAAQSQALGKILNIRGAEPAGDVE